MDFRFVFVCQPKHIGHLPIHYFVHQENQKRTTITIFYARVWCIGGVRELYWLQRSCPEISDLAANKQHKLGPNRLHEMAKMNDDIISEKD